MTRTLLAEATAAWGLALAAALAAMGLGARIAGGWGYAIDDPWIHLALARNLAERGVWAPWGDELASASSSPGWILLLTPLVAGFGARPWLPFALAAASGWAALLSAVHVLADGGLDAPVRRRALGAVAFAAPIPAMLAIGMEHTLQIALTLPFAWAAAASRTDGRARGVLLALAPALVLVRYESLFLVAGASALLLARRQALGLALPPLALAGPAVFAAWSRAHGGLALPNPVVVKGRVHALDSAAAVLDLLQGHGFAPLGENPVVGGLLAAVAAALGVRAWQLRTDRPELAFAALFVADALAQSRWASLGWFWRYEAWLVAHGAIALVLLARPLLSAGSSVVLLLLTPLLLARGVFALALVPNAVIAIRIQQGEVARFVAATRPALGGRPVVVNDIGLTGFYAGPPLVDLAGLASTDVARTIAAGALDTAHIDALTAGSGYAVLYPHWFDTLPPSWRPIARWRFAFSWPAAQSDAVTFYAIAPGIDEPLRDAILAHPLPFAARVEAP